MAIKQVMKNGFGFAWQVGHVAPAMLVQNLIFLATAVAVSLLFFLGYFGLDLLEIAHLFSDDADTKLDIPPSVKIGVLAISFAWFLHCTTVIFIRFTLRYAGSDYRLGDCLRALRGRFVMLLCLVLLLMMLLFVGVGFFAWQWFGFHENGLSISVRLNLSLLSACLFWAIYCVIPYFAEAVLRGGEDGLISGTKLVKGHWGALGLVSLITAGVFFSVVWGGQSASHPALMLAFAIGGVICVGIIAMACFSTMVEQQRAATMSEAIAAFE